MVLARTICDEALAAEVRDAALAKALEMLGAGFGLTPAG
jgi:hypothetical protein